jgi:PAS domain S-box-containing protein
MMRDFIEQNKQIKKANCNFLWGKHPISSANGDKHNSVALCPPGKTNMLKNAVVENQKMKTSLRILNLEDSVDDATLNNAMLSARWPECELVRVETREDFIAALDDGGFDIILSDFTMPVFDGRQALALAREKRPEVPFLFVSGTIGEDTAIEALKNGATDYVLKHRLLRLIPTVDRALREAEEHAECQRAGESMRESEHKYRELFECLTDAAFLADEQSGKIIDANRAAENLLDRTRGEILGRKESQFLKLDKTRDRVETSEADQPSSIAFKFDMDRPDGATVSVEVHTTRLKLYGHPLVLRLCHELTER